MGTTPHGVAGALAGPAGGSALISLSRDCSTSLLQPSEHVGKQIAGGGGWRAACGSGGISAGGTTTGGSGAGGVAQPDSSTVSSSSVGAIARSVEVGSIGNLL